MSKHLSNNMFRMEIISSSFYLPDIMIAVEGKKWMNSIMISFAPVNRTLGEEHGH